MESGTGGARGARLGAASEINGSGSSTTFRAQRGAVDQGQFAEAWSSHALSLQEPDDIAQVKSWLDGLVARHADQPNAHLVMGLFLSQSGQSEQSMQSYRTAAKLAPQSAYPHYFLADS